MLSFFKVKHGKKRGQALTEYLVLIAVIASVTMGFVNFLVTKVYVPGLSALPAKMEQCLTAGGTRNGVCR